MSVTDTTTTTAHLDPAHVETIVEMLQRGRRISEVIAAGLNVQGGWRKNDVIDVVSARRWRLDSDGRIPIQYRTAVHPPADVVRGAPAPVPGRPASWPEHGSRQPDPPLRPVPTPPTITATASTITVPRGDGDGATNLIAQGKAHSIARVRKLADKAETVLADLRAALGAESEREQLRARLADLDAERDRLRAKLAGPGRPPKPRPAADDQPKPPAASGKPIEHGTWGGYMAETKRGLDHCEPCTTAKDDRMAAMRAGKDQQP